MNGVLGIGVIGCSSIAAKSVLPAITRNAHFRLVRVGSRTAEKARCYADRFQCAGGTYNDVLRDEAVQAVYVSLPVAMHHEWGRLVLEAGKHLLLEKTFTDTERAAEDIIMLARSARRVAMEALHYVYHPLFQRVMQVIRSGGLGALRHAEAYFGIPHRPDTDIRYQAKLGGGAILDALIYPLSFCLQLAQGSWTSLHDHCVFDADRGVETRGFLQLNWDQFTAYVGFGFGLMYRNTYTVWGEHGLLTADRVFSRPPDLTGAIHVNRPDHSETITVPPADQFELMLDAFWRKIQGEDLSGMNEGRDIITRMAVIGALYEKSRREGKALDASGDPRG